LLLLLKLVLLFCCCQGGGVFSVQYTPFRTGVNLRLSVSIAGRLLGSLTSSPAPYNVTVTPAAFNQALSTISGLGSINTAGVDVVSNLTALDLYGNPWLSDNGVIYATCLACTSSTCTAFVSPAYQLTVVSAVQPGVFMLTFSGASNTKASYYSVSLYAVGQPIIPVGALTFQTVAANTYPPLTIVSALSTITVFTTMIETFATFDQFSNPVLKVASSDVITYHFYNVPSSGALICADNVDDPAAIGTPADGVAAQPPAVYGASTGTWNISITPVKLGFFYLNISINGAPIPCSVMSLLSFAVVPGVGNPSRSFVTGPSSVIAGTKTTFFISINDAFNNSIGRPSSQQPPNQARPNHSIKLKSISFVTRSSNNKMSSHSNV
jgi:hypothetical protein